MALRQSTQRLNRQFELWIGIGVCVPLLVVGYLWIHHLRADVEEEFRQRHGQVLSTLSANMLEPLQIFLPETASMQVKLLMQDEAVHSVRVYSGLFDMDLASFVRTRSDDAPILLSRKHIFQGGEVLGFVELAFSRKSLNDHLVHKRNEVLFFFLILSVIMSFLLYISYWKRVKVPLARLQAEARRLSTGDYDTPLRDMGDSMLGNIPECMEDMRGKMQAAHLQVELLTTRDPVTRIPYHDLFLEIASREIAFAGRFGLPVCLVLFSYDVQGIPGDGEMDRLPETYAARLTDLVRSRLRSLDVLGVWDESVFALLMPERTQVEAVDDAEILRQVLAEGFANEGITFSFGIASYWGADTMVSLFKRAAGALYQAADAGGNCVKKA